LKVLLAGFNLDSEFIQECKRKIPDVSALTPETISAAYARISRSPLPVNDLRQESRKEVERARKSNQTIVFGMGHSSIAEHAVFNIDILGISRLLVEEIEKSRLCSYTEKSQRYVLFESDFVLPRELKDTGLEELFVKTIREQNSLYHELYEKLRNHVIKEHKKEAKDPANLAKLEGWAKEDARYIISMATETQLGMTLNARNLELMLRRTAAHPLEEAREFSRKLHEISFAVAPSLVRYGNPTEYELETKPELKEIAKRSIATWGKKKCDDKPRALGKKGNVVLYYATPNADERMAAILLYTSSGYSMEKCLNVASLMAPSEKKELFKSCFRYMKSYDASLREFENVDLYFEMTVSSSCFAQLKRHRMATLHAKDYDLSLGVTIPPAVNEIGMSGRFREIIEKSEETYQKIKPVSAYAAEYVLTNAHRRRLSFKCNAREMHHIARLRADNHAQWDIRETAERMLALAKRAMPLTMMMATGKDSFESLYSSRFSAEKTPS
jgi:flavin-dependent thymidylate synthase